jgi:hypothetical protein
MRAGSSWVRPVALLGAALVLGLLLLQEMAPGSAQQGQPDLFVKAQDVWVSPQRPLAGDIVAVKAAIRNSGDADAHDVLVQFTDNAAGALQMLVSIGSATVDVPAGGMAIAEVAWDTSGQFAANDITVDVDPENAIPESDDQNNQAMASIFVSALTGDVNCLHGVDVVDSLAILRWDAGLDVNQLAPCPVIGE